MSKSYYKLKDTGSSFFDVTQGAGVVRDKVALLENTARVNKAVNDNVLIKLDPDEGKAKYAEQEGIASKKATASASTETNETSNDSESDGSADSGSADSRPVKPTGSRSSKK